ncbi:MAG TPA: hypothetical protein PLW44_02875 [Chitinophagales bacterium]|nr:hypothetical protein [Chitinophagales bacterium]
MTCKEATYLHEIKKEGKLTLSQRVGLWVHLLYCNLCRRFVKQTDVLSKQVKELSNNTGTLSPDAKQKMQQAINNGLTNNQ